MTSRAGSEERFTHAALPWAGEPSDVRLSAMARVSQTGPVTEPARARGWPVADITIRHTPAEGTLIEGSRKGDGVWEVLRQLRDDGHGNWRWSRDIGLYLGQSRDKPADT